MLCPNCEAENREEAKFCDECGFPLSGAIARVAGAASPKGSSGRPGQAHREPVPARERNAESHPLPPEEPAPSREAAYEPEPIDDFDPFDEPAVPPVDELVPPIGQDDPFEPAPFDDLPMSDIDYEASPWSYGQDAVQQSDVLPDDLFATDDGQDSWSGEFTMEMPRLDQGRHPAVRDFRVDPPHQRRGRSRLAVFIAAGVAVGALIAVAVTFALGFWGGVAVPNVTGMTEADARGVLEGDGFSVRTTQVKSDDTEGLVLIMDPGAGSRAPEGSEVVIHIATARFIPSVVGKSGEEARALLDEAGYENVRYETQKSDGEENRVLEVTPEEGTRAKSNAEVIVKVSEAYRVPNVEGLDADAAVDAITDAGLSPEVVYIDTDQFPDGSIIGTDPAAGTKVDQGDSVSISVARARGVELVSLTESMFAQGSTVTVGGVDYEIESVISVSYQGDDTVAFTANGRPKITFFGETLYASSSQTISGYVVWSDDNEVISIS